MINKLLCLLQFDWSCFKFICNIAACVGGDSCCSETNRCDVGEGDCDKDSHCLDGLKCGSDNCPSSRTFGSTEWDYGDDCCYKPGMKLKYLKSSIKSLKSSTLCIFNNK